MTTVEDTLIPVAAAPAGQPYRHVSVSRVAGACGAVVSGVDLAAGFSDAAVAEVRRALLDPPGIFFRDQRPAPDPLLAFSPPVGPPSPGPFVQPGPEHPAGVPLVRATAGA